MRLYPPFRFFVCPVFLVIAACGCGQVTQQPVSSVSTIVPRQATPMGGMARMTDRFTEQATAPAWTGYPAEETPVFDGEGAYPSAGQTETAEAWVRTLTAQPSPTVTELVPTSTITPTRAPLANPLPAPVYFLSRETGRDAAVDQIWRMERDGSTLARITDEDTGVDYRFDVTADGRLAYVTHNDLFVTDAWGGNRRMVVDGPEPPEVSEDPQYNDNEQILSPAWSPDGRKIAYWQDGVNLVNLTNGKTIKVLKQPEPVEARGPRSWPVDWTPDGSRIILHQVRYEEFGTAFIRPVQDGTLEPVDIFAAGCCDFSFTEEGQMLFSSGDHTEIGLWLVDPQSGQVRNLTGGRQYKQALGPVIMAPQQAPDGRIFFFTTANGGYIDAGGKMLAFVDAPKDFLVPEDVTFVSKTAVQDVLLWLPDASGVIVVETGGQVMIIETGSGAAIPLGLEGGRFKWGGN